MYSIRLDGDVRRLMKRIHKLENVNLKDAGEVLGQVLRSSTLQRFKEEKGPDGKSWEKTKNKKGKTLTDTARLKNSIKVRSDENGSFAVGTNTIYAGRHQFGDKKPLTIKAKKAEYLKFMIDGHWVSAKSVTIKLPARPFLGISEEDMEEIKNTLIEIVGED